ncbi:ABC transporter permease [Moorella naiadis]|uniref:ABC transporter permease n=1 Tax=Moorella naiadis (nom. illeg.) TaxID=3093670 RepID=UPI003D9C86F8
MNETYSTNKRWLRGVISFVVLLAIWQISYLLANFPATLYPPPLNVLHELILLGKKGILLEYFLDSMLRLLIAASISFALSIPLGLILGYSSKIADMVLPFINFFQSIADMAWLPIVIFWLGYGTKTIILVVAYTVFFPVLFNTILGVKQVPKNMINAILVLGGTRKHVLFNILLPGAIPNIVTGIRVGVGYAFRSLIAGEMIAGTNGLGYMIFDAQRSSLTQRVVVGMILMGIIWLVLDRFYLKPFEKATIERWGMVEKAR